MTLLKPAPVSTERLTHVAAENMLAACASDLPEFERVWDDACDVGVTVVSHRTGREVVYAVEEQVRDGEGDTLYWMLQPASLADQRAGLPGLQVFND